MAAAFSVTITCTICGHTTAITNTNEATNGSHATKEIRYNCSYCNAKWPISFAIIAVTHSANVGAFQTVTHTMATPGSISSAASNAA